MKRVLYPGSFDPLTLGHMNIINQAINLFDEIYIAILENRNKKEGMFTYEERLELIKKIYGNYPQVKVILAKGAAVDVALDHDCQAIIRGLRSLSDFDYEVGMQQINKEISHNKVNTICFFADKEYQFVSCSMVKEVFYLGKDISKYVDPTIEKALVLKRG